MKTLFAFGFKASHDVWDRRTVGGVFLGQGPARRSPSLGRGLSAAEIDQLTAMITTGRQKQARINAWIESKKAAQPFGWKLFDDDALQANFFNWQSTANSEEDSVARIWEGITNPSSADYDVDQDDLIRAKDWANMVNWMTGAMEDYGGRVTTTPATTPTNLPGIAPMTPVTGVKPGIKPANPLLVAPEPKILGVPQNTFVVGAGALAIAGILTYALVT